MRFAGKAGLFRRPLLGRAEISPGAFPAFFGVMAPLPRCRMAGAAERRLNFKFCAARRKASPAFAEGFLLFPRGCAARIGGADPRRCYAEGGRGIGARKRKRLVLALRIAIFLPSCSRFFGRQRPAFGAGALPLGRRRTRRRASRRFPCLAFCLLPAVLSSGFALFCGGGAPAPRAVST